MVLGDCGAEILYLSLGPGPSLRSALLPIFSSPGTSRFVSLAPLDGYHDLSTEASGSITALYIYKFLPIFSSPGTSLRSMSSHPVSRFVSLAPLDGYHDLVYLSLHGSFWQYNGIIYINFAPPRRGVRC